MFFTSFFYGMIVGALMWPYLVKYLSKRNAILIAITLQGISTAFTGVGDNLYMIFFMRFIAGCMQNMNNVGKDFIFEFADDDHKQYAFSLKSCFGVVALFITPSIGYYLYSKSGKSFILCCFYISLIYIVGIILFIIVFYFDYEIPHEKHKELVDDEESEVLVKKTEEEVSEAKMTLTQAFGYMMKNKRLRDIIIVYVLANSVFKTMNLLSSFYLEAPLDKEGLGVSSKTLTIVAFLSYFPSVIILMTSPLFVPSKFTYKGFISLIIFLFFAATFLTPIFKEFVTEKNMVYLRWLIYFNQSMVYWANPKIFSPFINYIVNKSIDANGRTALNSVSFILSTVSAAILMNTIVPLFAYTVDPKMMNQSPFNKYIAFGILEILLITCLIILMRLKSN